MHDSKAACDILRLVTVLIRARYGLRSVPFFVPKNREQVFPKRHEEDDGAADHPDTEHPRNECDEEACHTNIERSSS